MNRQYRPVLKKLGLTYSQYLVMLVLWENNNTRAVITVKQLGKQLDLDYATLSPLLKRLEKQALLGRFRHIKDERIVEIKLTTLGCQLKSQAQHIPSEMFAIRQLSVEQLQGLNSTLDKLLVTMSV